MKQMLILFIGAAIFTACSSNDKVKQSIPGTYVRSDYGKTQAVLDTVMICHEGDQSYHILHKQSKGKQSGNRWVTLGRMREIWFANYMPDKQILVEKKEGLILAFDQDRQLLLVNGQAFRRMDE